MTISTPHIVAEHIPIGMFVLQPMLQEHGQQVTLHQVLKPDIIPHYRLTPQITSIYHIMTMPMMI